MYRPTPHIRANKHGIGTVTDEKQDKTRANPIGKHMKGVWASLIIDQQPLRRLEGRKDLLLQKNLKS